VTTLFRNLNWMYLKNLILSQIIITNTPLYMDLIDINFKINTLFKKKFICKYP
jgi:hypothetical protein